jgi:anti-anti-sigma regulatory factor
MKEQSVGIVLSQTDDSSRICLEGVIDIACAEQLKTALLRAIEAGKKICLSVEQATDLDVTAFQLLWTAVRAAGEKGVPLAFAEDFPVSIRASLANVGLGGALDSFAGLVERDGALEMHKESCVK